MKKLTEQELLEVIKNAYLAGFKVTGEGYNNEYPFEGANPMGDNDWAQECEEYAQQTVSELSRKSKGEKK